MFNHSTGNNIGNYRNRNLLEIKLLHIILICNFNELSVFKIQMRFSKSSNNKTIIYCAIWLQIFMSDFNQQAQLLLHFLWIRIRKLFFWTVLWPASLHIVGRLTAFQLAGHFDLTVF
ncbi:hypothetical protein BpHYR1_017972 [Brachionus plicatilis]|uniref:Uncharacterized protein n=1 Tax=Brachionus plicatilis TaxID=10195 RepID=A0A3M7R6W9_BRAPC|nr:hypothetical protein BpHYR1_017972 [Brachionus plicatilis]